MAGELNPFFTKHAKSFGDKEAIEVIYSKICEAKKDAGDYEKDSKHYNKHLAEAFEMIDDYFECKGIDQKKLLQG